MFYAALSYYLHRDVPEDLTAEGELTLDAQGDADAIFVFQMASSLTVTSGRQVILAGGAWSSLFLRNLGLRLPQLKTNLMMAMSGHMTGALDRMQELTSERVPQRVARAMGKAGSACAVWMGPGVAMNPRGTYASMAVHALNGLLGSIDAQGINERMDYRYPPGAVRRLDDALLAIFGEQYVTLEGNSHRVPLLRARLEKLTTPDG